MDYYNKKWSMWNCTFETLPYYTFNIVVTEKKLFNSIRIDIYFYNFYRCPKGNISQYNYVIKINGQKNERHIKTTRQMHNAQNNLIEHFIFFPFKLVLSKWEKNNQNITDCILNNILLSKLGFGKSWICILFFYDGCRIF